MAQELRRRPRYSSVPSADDDSARDDSQTVRDSANGVSARDAVASEIFQAAQKQAAEFVKEKTLLERLVHNAYELICKLSGDTAKQMQIMLEMLEMHIKGEFDVATSTVLVVVAAALYFVNPIDLSPDSVLIDGFFDDAAVIRFSVRQIGEDLQRFQDWKSQNQRTFHFARNNKRVCPQCVIL